MNESDSDPIVKNRLRTPLTAKGETNRVTLIQYKLYI